MTETTRSNRRVPQPRDQLTELCGLVEDHLARFAQLAVEHRELRALLARNQVELLRRVDELRDVMTAVPLSPRSAPPQDAPVPPAAPGAEPHVKAAEYARVLIRVRALVRSVVPLDATVLVVSRGDDDLLDLDGRAAWHFPQDHDGRWAGYHPRDSSAAITDLDALRARGADHLLLPATALWWLDHYVELRQWLERHARLNVRRDDACLIYALPTTESHS